MRFSRAFLLTFLTREGTLAFSFINSVVLARALGVEGIGAYSLVVFLAWILAHVGAMGLSFSNTYLAAREPGRAGLLFTQSLLPVVVLALPVVALERGLPHVMAVFFGNLPPRLHLATWIGAALLVLQLNLAAILFGLQRYKSHSSLTALATPGMLCTNLAMVALSRTSVERALVVWLAWQAVCAIASLGVTARLAKPVWRLDASLFVESLKVGGRALLTTALGFTANRGMLLLITHYLGRTALGFYSVALPVAEALAHAPSALGALLFSEASAGKKDPAQVAQVIRLHLVLDGAVAAGLILAAPWFFPAFFGARFEEAVTPFRILAGGYYLLGLWSLASGYLSGRWGYPPVVIGLTAFMAGATLALGAWWIRPWGLVGASAAWATASGAASVAMLWIFRRAARGQIRNRDLCPRWQDLEALRRAVSARVTPT